MSQKSVSPKLSSERIVKDIRRATRRHYSAFRRRENPHRARGPARRTQHRRAVPARRHRREPAGDTERAAVTGEVKDLRRQAKELKEVVAENALELRLLKKSMIVDGGDEE